MKKAGYAFSLVLYVTVCAAAQTGIDWTPFKSEALGYSVTNPDRTLGSHQATTKDYPTGHVVSMIATGKGTDYFYLQGVTDYFVKADASFDVQRDLDAERDNFIKAVNGTLVSDRKTDFGPGKIPEIEFIFTMNAWTGKSFAICEKIDDQKDGQQHFTVYQLVFAYRTGADRTLVMDKYLNSFALIPRKN